MEFTDLLQQLRIPFQIEGNHHCRPGWIQTDCPFCGRNTQRWHLGWSLRGHYFNCWKCGPHRQGDTLSALANVPIKTALSLLDGIETTKYQDRTELDHPARKYVAPKGIAPLPFAHRNYLRGRRFIPHKLVQTWKIAGGILPGEIPWRIFIPVYFHSELVSWTSRTIGNQEPRYLSAQPDQELIFHKHLLYGEDYCRHSIVVVEGPTDVWRIGPGAAATFGTGFTKEQVLRISKYARRTICYDSSVTAQEKARELCDALDCFQGETYRVELNSDDPGEATDREVAKLRHRFLE